MQNKPGRRRLSAEKLKEKAVLDRERTVARILEHLIPKTKLGKIVRAGEISSLEEIFNKKYVILEPEIVDYLVKDLQEKVIESRKTSKVRRAGRMFSFRSTVLVGDRNHFAGIGVAKDKEKWPSIRKATKKAKLNLVKVNKGCGSWECICGTAHSVPFKVKGKCGSVKVSLLPAPKGTGLVVGDNAKDVFRFVGIEDVWIRTRGNTRTTLNFVRAVIDALHNTTKIRGAEEKKKPRRE